MHITRTHVQLSNLKEGADSSTFDRRDHDGSYLANHAKVALGHTAGYLQPCSGYGCSEAGVRGLLVAVAGRTHGSGNISVDDTELS
jgi:hypothetical protein